MNPEDAVVLNPTTYLSENDPALKNAWQYYNAFDAASIRQKEETLRIRRLIILLGFLTVSFAAISTLSRSPRFAGTLIIFGVLALLINEDLLGYVRPNFKKNISSQQLMGVRVGIVLLFTVIITALH